MKPTHTQATRSPFLDSWPKYLVLTISWVSLTAQAKLVHQWTFNDGTGRDSVGQAHGTGYRNPLIRDGKLHLNGVGQCLITGPLGHSLAERSLVVWVALSNLTQRGGTALTIAVAGHSEVFDGIEYGGTSSNHWDNASENGRRSKTPAALTNCPAETSTGMVMLTMVYGDGNPDNIKLYRNAVLYADYTPNHPRVTYSKGRTHALMGVPHHAMLGQMSAVAGQGPALAGIIDEARIYNHALSPAEVGQLFALGPVPVPAAFWSTVPFQAMAVVALMAGILLWLRALETRRYRQRLVTLEQQSTLHAERARIAKDMHDELGANLTRIKLLSELIEREAASADQTTRHARRISQTARELAQGMDEIVWAVNPEKDRLENLVFYVGAFTEELLGVTHLRYRLHLPEQVPELTLPADVRHHLFLAMKEALHNAVKHSQATEVIVRLTMGDDWLEIQVQDDGAGFVPKPTASRRHGLSNICQRLARIGGTCTIESQPGAGTTVTLTAPMPKNPRHSHV